MIIDEAGMADTVSLDAVVQFAMNPGASVRLVGDDQQLAAVGAGGVLRDIKHTLGALQLTELHRFTNPAEGQASLLLRDGHPKALEFYLKHGRVHVGDLATTTEDAFSAGLPTGRLTLRFRSTRDCAEQRLAMNVKRTNEDPRHRARRARRSTRCRECSYATSRHRGTVRS